ncbi:MAG: hypothetical protein HQL86_09110 [Magnetococcales bacterium]|nr:hypothetical protein [Magnetococcales bacterium]
MLIPSEQGLYFFLGRSDKPKALPFQKWLAGQVLPSICKTGQYQHPAANQEASGKQAKDADLDSIPGRIFRLKVGE